MMAMLAPFAKAIAALVAPLLIPLLHYIGLVEITAPGLQLALSTGLTALAVYAIPNKAAAVVVP